VLRSSLREFVCSEAMHHLGVPTTRALALVATGEPVMRDMFYDGNPELEPGAIVAASRRPSCASATSSCPRSAAKTRCCGRLVDARWPSTSRQLAPPPRREASRRSSPRWRAAPRMMVAHWMRVGFVHGVMNTDNMSILGLTIDYGPYGWLEPFDLTGRRTPPTPRPALLLRRTAAGGDVEPPRSST
jgi:hypothetical protein